eukprot:gb/GEZN01011100.1/.p1 GENE.gb/GEZN01011100.1/~~gb/GEZN01011100.1/.p1  ORF type:complete len:253 (-),score=40.95 gb/GEZN01011100.1/:403-1161(-)
MKEYLMLGLSGAGKSCLLARWRGQDFKSLEPTVGMDVQTVEVAPAPLPFLWWANPMFHARAEEKYVGTRFQIFDVSGKNPALWRHYYKNTSVVCFVVDASDPSKFPVVQEALRAAMAARMLSNAALLVIANKSDVPSAVSAQELAKALRIETFAQRSLVLSASAKTGDGAKECLAWLREETHSKEPDCSLVRGLCCCVCCLGSCCGFCTPIRTDKLISAPVTQIMCCRCCCPKKEKDDDDLTQPLLAVSPRR